MVYFKRWITQYTLQTVIEIKAATDLQVLVCKINETVVACVTLCKIRTSWLLIYPVYCIYTT